MTLLCVVFYGSSSERWAYWVEIRGLDRSDAVANRRSQHSGKSGPAELSTMLSGGTSEFERMALLHELRYFPDSRAYLALAATQQFCVFASVF
jgi:hypothetical protein